MFSRYKYLLLALFLSLLIVYISADNSTSTNGTKFTIKSTIVNQGPDVFYDYSVSQSNGWIIIDITDQNVSHYQLTFNKTNPLYFRANYYDFIIVQERNQSVSYWYWVIQIVRIDQGFYLKNFNVNSTFNSQDYLLQNVYFLDTILEYDPTNKFLYVVLMGAVDISIYQIDVGNEGSLMVQTSRFNSGKAYSAYILGGNQKVLVDGINTQFWIDTSTHGISGIQYSNFTRLPIQNMTSLPIYKGGSHVFELFGSYFEYFSLSQDNKSISAFLYHGYGDQKIQGQVHLESKDQILYFSDFYNIFVAIGDTDIYLTIVDWDQSDKYIVYANTLSNTIPDNATTKQDIIQLAKSVVWLVYNDHKIYVLTSDKFYVFGGESYFQQLYETQLAVTLSKDSNIVDIMFTQIKQYIEMK